MNLNGVHVRTDSNPVVLVGKRWQEGSKTGTNIKKKKKKT